MTRAISRESFNELKNYLGVYLQQGRPILDSDWNENQDIALSFLRRLSREALGDGSPNDGFRISPAFPPPIVIPSASGGGGGGGGGADDLGEAIGQIIGICLADLISIMFQVMFGSLPFFLNFPGFKLDGFESLGGWALSTPQGTIRIGKDRPYEGLGFLRISGHPGTVRVTKTLPALVNISAYEMATFRFRLNEQVTGDYKFFLEDDNGNRSEWKLSNSAFAPDLFLAAFAAPLDIRYKILTDILSAAYVTKSYSSSLQLFRGQSPYTWSISAGALPPGLTLTSGTGADSKEGKISGTPTAVGTFNFTVRAVDATNKAVTHAYTLKVDPGPPPPASEIDIPASLTEDFLAQMMEPRVSDSGTPADLTKIRKYGFEVYQNGPTPLVWDFDDLQLGGAALQEQIANNNFIIRGSQLSQFLSQLTLLSLLQALGDDGSGGGGGGGGSGDEDDFLSALLGLLDLANTEFDLTNPNLENAGRMYVSGFPCVLVRDILYSDQADPNDPPLAPPTSGPPRKDTVYLDVWQEPVTYVEDPEIREIALGGPDTSTRLRGKFRVRVAQGGTMPKGNGVGQGTLATEGGYTARANRLYRVEIDTPGDIGVATFRWSEDNAATIQRVIAPVPPNSTKVTVEDASAFHPGDYILIRKQFGEERHRVLSVFSNVITLQDPTGAQLATYPAAAANPTFTTFAMSDRPMVQRWNAFRVPIVADPSDPTISASTPLNDGVALRFGGRKMNKGDYWNFKTRYLAGDEVSGLNPVTRIEDLGFVRARGVVHYYAPLALITRDPAATNPQRINNILDRRPRVGNAVINTLGFDDITVTGFTPALVGGSALPPSTPDSQFVVILQADMFVPPLPNATDEFTMKVTVSFYNDAMTDPIAEPDEGKIQDRTMTVALRRKPKNVEVPLTLIFAKSDLSFAFLPIASVPTSVQIVVQLEDPKDPQNSFSVELTGLRATVLELKKSF